MYNDLCDPVSRNKQMDLGHDRFLDKLPNIPEGSLATGIPCGLIVLPNHKSW